MTGPPTSAFVQLTCRYTGAALPLGAVTTHGFTAPTAPDGDVDLALEEFADNLVAQCSTSVTLTDILIKTGPVATGPSRLVTINEDGTQGSEPLPPQVATLVRLGVANISGRFAGRFYLPPMGEGATIGGGLMTTGTQDAAILSVTTAYNALLAVGMEPRIFPAGAGDPRVVDTIQVMQRFASQRRRNRR